MCSNDGNDAWSMLEQCTSLFSFPFKFDPRRRDSHPLGITSRSCVMILLYMMLRWSVYDLAMPKLQDSSHLIVARVTISFDPIRFRDCVVADRRLPVLCDGFVKFFASKQSCSCVLLLSIGGSVSTHFNLSLFFYIHFVRKARSNRTSEPTLWRLKPSLKRASYAFKFIYQGFAGTTTPNQWLRCLNAESHQNEI